LVAWTSGCQFRCLYCHNPDTWNMSNGIPITLGKATEELRKYRHGLKVMSGRIHLERWRATHAGSVRRKAVYRGASNGHSYHSRHQRQPGERRTSGRPALPSNGPIQVEGTQT